MKAQMVTTSPANEERAAIEARLSELSTFLDNAISEVEQNNLIDLGNMEHDIGELCITIENSAPDIAHDMKPLMADLIAKLDNLATSITRYQTEIEEQKNNG